MRVCCKTGKTKFECQPPAPAEEEMETQYDMRAMLSYALEDKLTTQALHGMKDLGGAKLTPNPGPSFMGLCLQQWSKRTQKTRYGGKNKTD